MKTEKKVLECMRIDALYACLEFYNSANLPPDKEVYDDLMKCENPEGLDHLISIMEKGHGIIEKLKQNKPKKTKESLKTKIINIFK